MLTYQDFLQVEQRDEQIMEFVRMAINQHKDTDLYKKAVIAAEYARIFVLKLPTIPTSTQRAKSSKEMPM